MSDANLNKSLRILRLLYQEGIDLKNRLREEFNRDNWEWLYADVIGWSGRVKQMLGHLFYNQKIVDDYEKSISNAIDSRGDTDVHQLVAITIDHIKSLGQLLKFGYVKDPYTGICNDDSNICFVAMWFDEKMNEIYANGIEVPMQELGYSVVRIDKVSHNDRIDQLIFNKIRQARFMIADFTGNRAGVYYEAGFASGQGIPVVHICHAVDFDKRHFDIGTVNTIKYNDSNDLASQLTKRVNDTIGRYVKIDKQQIVDDGMPF